jgi:hypothetical protein
MIDLIDVIKNRYKDEKIKLNKVKSIKVLPLRNYAVTQVK